MVDFTFQFIEIKNQLIEADFTFEFYSNQKIG